MGQAERRRLSDNFHEQSSDFSWQGMVLTPHVHNPPSWGSHVCPTACGGLAVYSQTIPSDQRTREDRRIFFLILFFFFKSLKGLWLLSELDLEMSYHRNEKTIAWVEVGQKIVFL